MRRASGISGVAIDQPPPPSRPPGRPGRGHPGEARPGHRARRADRHRGQGRPLPGRGTDRGWQPRRQGSRRQAVYFLAMGDEFDLKAHGARPATSVPGITARPPGPAVARDRLEAIHREGGGQRVHPGTRRLRVGDGAEVWNGPRWAIGRSDVSTCWPAPGTRGFPGRAGRGGHPHGLRGHDGSGRPIIGILGEYDALPGLSQQAEPVRRPRPGLTAGHGRGHYLFGTASAAACLALAERVKAGTMGTLRFYGCPAEEGGSAKAFMVRAHLFDDCDAVLHWHPSSENATGNVSSQARIAARIRFHGISGTPPEPPRPAAGDDPVELMNHAAELLREHTPDYTRIHHVITAAASAKRGPRLRRGAVLHPTPRPRSCRGCMPGWSSAPRPAPW